MPKKNIENVYRILEDMIQALNKLEDLSQDLVQEASLFGGEISRIVGEQITSYFGPTIAKMKDDENTPGCLKGIVRFLDSVPLAATRVDPTIDDMVPPEESATQIDPSTLPASSSVDQTSEIPQNASYNNPQGIQTQVQESTLQEKHITYCIKRKGMENSALGDDVGNITPHIVSEYRTKAEADIACDKLNKGVLPGEKEVLGTEYFVDEIEFGDDNLIDKD